MAQPLPGPMEHTQEWEEQRFFDPERKERPVIFGASDAAAACGRSQYRTPLDLYVTQRREVKRFEPEGEVKARLRRGRAFQPVVVAEYELETGFQVEVPDRSFLHATLPFMAATPDGIVHAPDRVFGLECKTTTPIMYAAGDAMERNKYGQEDTDIVPDEVLYQCQQQMAVMDWEVVHVPVFFGMFVMRTYVVPKSRVIQEAIEEAEQELAERIVDGRPPDPNWVHPNTRSLIDSMNGFRANEVTQLGEDELALWLHSQELSQEIKKLEEAKEECRNRILYAMAGAEIGRFPMGTVELRRLKVKESIWSPKDIEEAQKKQGTVKRKGHERLMQRKVK